MSRQQSEKAIVKQLRRIVTEWQLARGATYSSGGISDGLEEKIRLPDDHGRPPPSDVLSRETQTYNLPIDNVALLRIEKALGMTPARPVRGNLRKQYENWIGMPPEDAKPT